MIGLYVEGVVPRINVSHDAIDGWRAGIFGGGKKNKKGGFYYGAKKKKGEQISALSALQLLQASLRQEIHRGRKRNQD